MTQKALKVRRPARARPASSRHVAACLNTYSERPRFVGHHFPEFTKKKERETQRNNRLLRCSGRLRSVTRRTCTTTAAQNAYDAYIVDVTMTFLMASPSLEEKARALSRLHQVERPPLAGGGYLLRHFLQLGHRSRWLALLPVTVSLLFGCLCGAVVSAGCLLERACSRAFPDFPPATRGSPCLPRAPDHGDG